MDRRCVSRFVREFRVKESLAQQYDTAAGFVAFSVNFLKKKKRKNDRNSSRKDFSIVEEKISREISNGEIRIENFFGSTFKYSVIVALNIDIYLIR